MEVLVLLLNVYVVPYFHYVNVMEKLVNKIWNGKTIYEYLNIKNVLLNCFHHKPEQMKFIFTLFFVRLTYLIYAVNYR